MRLRPTIPEPLPSPSGWCGPALSSSSRAVSIAEGASTTTSARTVRLAPDSSTYETPRARRPSGRRSTRYTKQRVRNCAPARIASWRKEIAASPRAWIGHPKPGQKPQELHAGRPWKRRELTAIGYGYGWYPSCSAAAAILIPAYIGGLG